MCRVADNIVVVTRPGHIWAEFENEEAQSVHWLTGYDRRGYVAPVEMVKGSDHSKLWPITTKGRILSTLEFLGYPQVPSKVKTPSLCLWYPMVSSETQIA